MEEQGDMQLVIVPMANVVMEQVTKDILELMEN